MERDDRTQLAVDPDARSFEGMSGRIERVARQPLTHRGRLHPQAEQWFLEAAVGRGDESAAGDAAGRQHERVGPDSQFPHGGRADDRADPAALQLHPEHRLADLDPPAVTTQRGP